MDGFLDEGGAADLRRRAVELVATGCNELSLNLERVSGLNASGLEALLRIEAMLPGARRSLTMTGPNTEVRAQLERAGLAEYVEGALPLDPSAELFGPSLISTSA